MPMAMPQSKRARNASRPRSSAAAAADPPRSSGWFSGLRRPSASRRADDDGTPLHEEIMLFILATFLDIADLVRCAATCRLWRRLVSGDAAFICRGQRRPGPGGKFIPPLAVGYFWQHDATTIHFVPMAPAMRRFPLLREPTPPSVTLVGDMRFHTSRIVTSRNGLLVLELRRGKHSRTLKLCVCNPMTGEVRALPPLTGKDGVGCYACTVLTADDYQYHQVQNSGAAGTPPPSATHYRLLMVYNRRDFTAFRSYSSEDGGEWGPERKVTGARLGKRQMGMGLTRGGVVAEGGRAAYWRAGGGVVFGLRLDTLVATKVSLLPLVGRGFNTLNTLLGTDPEGRLSAVQISWPFLPKEEAVDTVTIRVTSYSGGHGGGDSGVLQQDNGSWMKERSIKVMHSFPGNVRSTKVKLQWFCEKSGLVFFTACKNDGDELTLTSDLYTLSLSTRVIEKVPSNAWDGSMWENLYGYEMDQATYLASLAELAENKD